MEQQDLTGLLQKYDLPTPRYTSYPTVPYWDFSSMSEAKWEQVVQHRFEEENGEICIYIHLPFCENLCTFCACNKRITKNHAVEDPYIEAVVKEWGIYRSFLPYKPVIREIHLGGGTPTFFSPENLTRLINSITSDATIAPDHEFSVEVHPNYSTEAHIRQLAELGFNRISLGVQDFDPAVQLLINRVQSFEQTKQVIDLARHYGFQSINIDLIYGLPHQTIASIEHTMEKIAACKPERIAFYSYAHVPWKSKVQRRYTTADLPTAEAKWAMYSRGRVLLENAGFTSIGMDHFALPGDKLLLAAENGKLHRNFMGYTTSNSKLIIGLGASAIGDSWHAFAQNEKDIALYEATVNSGRLPIVNGHLLTGTDIEIRKEILNLMCRNKASLDLLEKNPSFFGYVSEQIDKLTEDGLVIRTDNQLKVTPLGKSFIRNISAAIDLRLWEKQTGSQTFSQAI